MSYPSFLKSLARCTPMLRDIIAERDSLRRDLEAVTFERDSIASERDSLRRELPLNAIVCVVI